MPVLNKLKHNQVKAATKPGLLSDGGGLFLRTAKSGSKSWIYRVNLNNKRREMGLGGFQDISLSEARDLAAQARKLVKLGIDPIEDRKTSLANSALLTTKSKTFKECAELYIADHEPSWKNAKHIQQWKNTLSTYAYPVFGNALIGDVDGEHVQQVLSKIWTSKTETASRLRSRIERVLDWARVKGYRSGENPARWKGKLEFIYANPGKLKNVKHMLSLDHQHLPTFYSKLRSKSSLSSRAAEFMILTVTRSGETIAGEWSEIDLDNRRWTIPKERMKGDKEHVVPLCNRAIDLLREIEPRENDFLFPSRQKGKHISSASLLKLIKTIGSDIGHPKITSHGFRASFKTWCSDTQDFDHQAVEFCLAHKIRDQAEAAYHRTNLLDKRRHIIETWEKYLDQSEDNIK